MYIYLTEQAACGHMCLGGEWERLVRFSPFIPKLEGKCSLSSFCPGVKESWHRTALLLND